MYHTVKATKPGAESLGGIDEESGESVLGSGLVKMQIRGVLIGLSAVCLAAGAGCSRRVEKDYRLASPYDRPMTLALAPVLNYSGTEDVDTLKVTDIFYSELQQTKGVSVVPINRVLAQMRMENIPRITSQQQASRLAESLGVDGLIIASSGYSTPGTSTSRIR